MKIQRVKIVTFSSLFILLCLQVVWSVYTYKEQHAKLEKVCNDAFYVATISDIANRTDTHIPDGTEVIIGRLQGSEKDDYSAFQEILINEYNAPLLLSRFDSFYRAAQYDIHTDFGVVRAYEWSTDETARTTPVVLLPGRSSGVPMWSVNLAGFAAGHRVIAFDALGDAGMSVQSSPLTSMADQAEWIDQVLRVLAPDGVHLVGHSFGGATATAYARFHPERVRSLALLEPVFTFGYPPTRFMAWAMVASLPLIPEGVRERALGRIGGADGETESQDPMAVMIRTGTRHYSADLPTPSPLSEDEASTMTMPVYVAIAEHESLAGGERAAQRAQELLPRATVKIWPDTTHSLPMQEPEALGNELEGFWSAAG